jgi:hypothetical protein
MSTRETTFWDTRLCLELSHEYRWYGQELHHSLLLRSLSFRTSGRDSFKGEGYNTPGVYIPLVNEYGFKHVISVDKTDAKF